MAWKVYHHEPTEGRESTLPEKKASQEVRINWKLGAEKVACQECLFKISCSSNTMIILFFVENTNI